MVQSFFFFTFFTSLQYHPGEAGVAFFFFRIFWNEDTSVTLFQVCFCMIVGAKKDRNIAQPVVSP